ncbi:MAG: DUF4238 domain-containing protein [Armatimonadetes bacterium]|nr:DUF4238 domain-containing protein [Armatimonadota bacterium]
MKQHLIPKFYLRGFADPGRPRGEVWIRRADRPTWEAKHPGAIAWKPDYYTLVGKDGDTSYLVEEMLYDVEDATAKLMRHKLLKREALSNEERNALSLFVAMMKVRVPANHRRISDFYSGIATKLLAMMHHEYTKRPSSLEAMKERERQRMGRCDWAELKPEDLDPSHFSEIVPTHQSVIRRSFEHMFKFADVLLQMGWTFYVSESPDFFITSDNPVHIVDTSNAHTLYGGGLLSKDVNVTLPLTKSMALVAGWRQQGDQFAQAPTAVVGEINVRSARCATGILVAPKPTFPGSEWLQPRQPEEDPNDKL